MLTAKLAAEQASQVTLHFVLAIETFGDRWRCLVVMGMGVFICIQKRRSWLNLDLFLHFDLGIGFDCSLDMLVSFEFLF